MTSIKEINTWTEAKLKQRIDEEVAKKYAELSEEIEVLKRHEKIQQENIDLECDAYEKLKAKHKAKYDKLKASYEKRREEEVERIRKEWMEQFADWSELKLKNAAKDRIIQKLTEEKDKFKSLYFNRNMKEAEETRKAAIKKWFELWDGDTEMLARQDKEILALKAELEKNNHRSAWFYIQGNGDPDVFELWGTQEELAAHIKKENDEKMMECNCGYDPDDCNCYLAHIGEFVKH